MAYGDAVTRLGLGGPSTQYVGFTARDPAAVGAADEYQGFIANMGRMMRTALIVGILIGL